MKTFGDAAEAALEALPGPLYARRYARGDASLIEPQPQQRFEARAIAGRFDDFGKLGASYTIVRDYAPIACGGIVPLWPGFAVAWGLASVLDGHAGRLIVRQIKRAIAEIDGLRRIEATARSDFAAAGVFLERIGFKRLALLKRYGEDGADHWLFEKLTEDAA